MSDELTAEAYWADLYARARTPLYRSAALLLPPAEAEEVVQEAFERAARVRGFAGEVREPIAWLRTAAARIALDRLRRKRAWERVRALLPASAPPSSPSSELRDALRRLDPRHRVALVLRFYQDAPYGEIGAALGISPESVGPLLTRAKAELREALRER